ncbi:MAG: VTT domain-containing protein [Verrucomicrobia bacterium]|nr:VTT domain-containing protein [Verrucomicrobiota bacterium]MDA1088014.1 VTT domain-containing protein [Verrucomicrobiota bacterium]
MAILLTGTALAQESSGLAFLGDRWIQEGSAGSLLIFIAIASATFLSDDLTCIAAGLFASNGSISVTLAVTACISGIFVGDMLLYAAGRTLGRQVIQKAPLKWMIQKGDLTRTTQWFERRGAIVILISRFTPGTRLPTFVTTGVLQLNTIRFAIYFLVTAALWAPLLVGAAYILGARATALLAAYQSIALPALIVLALLIWSLVHVILPLCSYGGRRRLLASWRRFTRWEFWPPWAFYPPVLFYVLLQAVKHRNLTAFTASNPSIVAGGFIGESKSRILRGLDGSAEYVARHTLVPASLETGARANAVDAFMTQAAISFPIVLKPDTGQRGMGVKITPSREEMMEYLAAADFDVVAQEYAAGREFGVFYYRIPGEASGRILSITDKRLPTVSGDGTRTLEQLILADDRAVCMARVHCRRHADRLTDIPADGEVVQLVELGTHCRGAVFENGAWVKTPQIEKIIDQISQAFPGFYFGRYDIRTPSVEDFQTGRNFKIVELNGVTSEVTHIYAPGYSLLAGYRDVMQQWRLAYEIGAANIRNGARPSTVGELIKLLLDYHPADI